MKKIVTSTGTCAVLADPESRDQSSGQWLLDAEKINAPPNTDVDVITVEDTHDASAASVSVEFALPLAVGVEDDRQEVMTVVLVVPAMDVTESDVEVDTELPTDVENCVSVALPWQDISDAA